MGLEDKSSKPDFDEIYKKVKEDDANQVVRLAYNEVEANKWGYHVASVPAESGARKEVNYTKFIYPGDEPVAGDEITWKGKMSDQTYVGSVSEEEKWLSTARKTKPQISGGAGGPLRF
jgi:hypothetical protein